MQTLLLKVTILVKVETEFNDEYAKHLFEQNSYYNIPSVDGVEVKKTEWAETEILSSTSK